MARVSYQDWNKGDGLILIESWARDGLTDEQIAKNIGISRTTLYEWKKKHSDIANALKRGKRPIDYEVENALLKRALGFEYEETETIVEINEAGEEKHKTKVVKRVALPDTTAAIFWLKNRKKAIWQRLSPSVQEKIDAEIRKLNLEASEIEAQTVIEDEIADDGFLEALNDKAGEVWQDEEM